MPPRDAGCGAWFRAAPPAAYSANTSAITFPNVSTKQRYAVSFGGVATQSVTLMLHDRLVGVGGLSSASTGSKTVSSASLTRYTSGANVQAWLEVTTASTTTQAVCHLLSYTGDANHVAAGLRPLTYSTAAIMKDALSTRALLAAA